MIIEASSTSRPSPVPSLPSTAPSGEYAIDSIDFAAEKWLCIEGGVEVSSKNVWRKLRTKPQIKKKVTRIAREKTASMLVSVEGESEDRRYDTVFCTPTLGCMQKMDLTSAQLNWGQKSAIRGLTYAPPPRAPSSFRVPGGSPMRHHVGWLRNPDVLLCSYSWRQDTLRIGSLVHPDCPRGEDELKEVLLQSLARLPGISCDVIRPLYVTHHAWNWHQDPDSMGAFAAFDTAEFSTLYPYLTRPAGGGLLHFAGEAMSTHHAWIVGRARERLPCNALCQTPSDQFLEREDPEIQNADLIEVFGGGSACSSE
ncbi:hypothetical protein DL765_010257 [Monosporascus sp. GIB2]|nr:hypothetical protein DL765_010257 [Monosporascus sp. GIB2]